MSTFPPTETHASSGPVLLLTGALCPSKVRWLAVAEPDIRLSQTVEAIVTASGQLPETSLVYCDNSGESGYTEQLRARLAGVRNLEILVYQGDTAEIEKRGKGYGEGEIIEYALSQSTALASAESFCKLTGRLRVGNLAKIHGKLKPGVNYINRYSIHTDKEMDTRLFCMDRSFYEKVLLHAHHAVQDEKDVFLEACFADQLKRAHATPRPLPHYPHYQGVSGSKGHDYGKSRLGYLYEELLLRSGFYTL